MGAVVLCEDIKGLDLKNVSREGRGMGLSWAFSWSLLSRILKEENSSYIAAKTTKVNGIFSREDNSTFFTLKGKEFAPVGTNSLPWSRLLLKGLPPPRKQTGSLEISRKTPIKV